MLDLLIYNENQTSLWNIEHRWILFSNLSIWRWNSFYRPSFWMNVKEVTIYLNNSIFSTKNNHYYLSLVRFFDSRTLTQELWLKNFDTRTLNPFILNNFIKKIINLESTSKWKLLWVCQSCLNRVFEVVESRFLQVLTIRLIEEQIFSLLSISAVFSKCNAGKDVNLMGAGSKAFTFLKWIKIKIYN